MKDGIKTRKVPSQTNLEMISPDDTVLKEVGGTVDGAAAVVGADLGGGDRRPQIRKPQPRRVRQPPYYCQPVDETLRLLQMARSGRGEVSFGEQKETQVQNEAS